MENSLIKQVLETLNEIMASDPEICFLPENHDYFPVYVLIDEERMDEIASEIEKRISCNKEIDN